MKPSQNWAGCSWPKNIDIVASLHSSKICCRMIEPSKIAWHGSKLPEPYLLLYFQRLRQSLNVSSEWGPAKEKSSKRYDHINNNENVEDKM